MFNSVFFHSFLELPNELREGAAFELAKNLKSCSTNFNKGNIKTYKVGFKSRKDLSFTLTNIQKRSYKKIRDDCFMFLPSYLPYYFYSTEKLPEEMTHDFSLHYDGTDFFLLEPIEVKPFDDINDDRLVVSLNPGVRTFLTWYCENGDYGKLCCGDSVARLYSLAIYLDKCLSLKARKNLETNKKGSIRSLKARLQKLIEKLVKK